MVISTNDANSLISYELALSEILCGVIILIIRLLKQKQILNYLTLIRFCVLLVCSSNCIAQDGYTSQPPQIAYWLHEKANAPTVIVIHGGPGVTHNYLLPEWSRLREYARLVFYDQRGSGRSQEADYYSWQEHVADLVRLIDDVVAPGEKVILAGSSWGVDLALLFTNQYPKRVRGLILSGITPWKGRGNRHDSCYNYTYKKPPEEFLQALEKDIKDKAPIVTPADLFISGPTYEETLIGEKNIDSSETIHFETITSLADAPRFEKLSINVPSIIFQGTNPCHFPDVSEHFAKKIKSGRVVLIEDSCHDPWIVNPQIFFSACGHFIETLKD